MILCNKMLQQLAGQDEELQNEILNDDEIVQAIYKEGKKEVSKEEGNVAKKMGHTKGRAALKLATTYIGLKATAYIHILKATAVDVMLIKNGMISFNFNF